MKAVAKWTRSLKAHKAPSSNLGDLWREAERFGYPHLYAASGSLIGKYCARIDLRTDNAHVKAEVVAWAWSPERALELAIAKARGENMKDEA